MTKLLKSNGDVSFACEKVGTIIFINDKSVCPPFTIVLLFSEISARSWMDCTGIIVSKNTSSSFQISRSKRRNATTIPYLYVVLHGYCNILGFQNKFSTFTRLLVSAELTDRRGYDKMSLFYSGEVDAIDKVLFSFLDSPI